MSNEIIFPHDTPALTSLYAVILNNVGQAFNTVTPGFEAITDANWDDYAISLTEGGTASQIYLGDFPAVAAGVYTVLVYDGAAPSVGDTLLGAGKMDWSGTAERYLSAVKLGNEAQAGDAAVLTLERMVVISITTDQPAVLLTGMDSGAGLHSIGGSSGHGAHFQAGGDGDGVRATGGSSEGHGLSARAAADGSGIQAIGIGTAANGISGAGGAGGAGIRGAGGTNGNGITGLGNGTGHGMALDGGATGHGLRSHGGATSGDGIHAEAATDGEGVDAVGKGSGDGIRATGGATSGAGIEAAGQGGGPGIRGTGGATGNGVIGQGGASAGKGMALIGTGGGEGLQATGSGDGAGIRADGGSTDGSAGIRATSNATNGDGMELIGTGTGLDLDATTTDNLEVALDVAAANDIADAVLDRPITEPGSVFAWGSATLRNIIGWLGALSRNRITQTTTTQALRNDADSGDIATATVSDDGTTASRGEFS
jgi:hypothetical protein